MSILSKAKHRIRKVANVDVLGNKINPESIDRVIAYGCSFTAGDEIVDHLLLNVSFDEVNKIKKNYSNQVEFYEKLSIEFPNDIMRNNSWAGQLAKLLNKPFINKAYPGYSIAQSYFQIYSDWKNNFITNKDLILLGLTDPSRIVWFNEELKVLDSAPLLNYIENCNYNDVEKKPILELFDDNLTAFNYFSFLNNIQQLKNHLNIRIQPMTANNTINSKHFSLLGIDSNILKYCLSVFDDCQSIILLSKEYLKNKTIDPKVTLCGYGHPPLESHIELAIKINDRCVIK